MSTGTGKLLEPLQAVLTLRDDRGRLILHAASINLPDGGSTIQVSLADFPNGFTLTNELARE